MRSRLRQALYSIRTSFWFIPGLMLVAAILLSWVAANIDLHLARNIKQRAGDWIVFIGPDGARTLLNTIAGSMITVASLVFSLTIIALTMAASNLGPRVITYFIRDRVTQVSLGLFLATFVYAMLILLVVRDADNASIVPYISLAVAIALSILCFAWLIFFVHRVANEIQADTVVANIAEELTGAIADVLDELAEDADPDASMESDGASFPDPDTTVVARRIGYVRLIDHDDIVRAACEAGACVRLLRRAGHFVVLGEPIAEIAWPEKGEAPTDTDTLKSEIQAAFVLGQKRTIGQDVEFALRQLVEVGVRALSPGINDFNTAIATIDRLTGALSEAFHRGLPKAVLRDDRGDLRLWLTPVTFEGMVDNAFNEIRQCAQGNVAVTIRLLEGLVRLARVARTEGQREAIGRQVGSLMSGAEEAIGDKADLEDIKARYAVYQDIVSGKGA